jgi:hypothetical protein
MKYAIIENQVVINIALADPEYAQSQGWVEATSDVAVGWGYVDGQFVPPPPKDYSAQNKAQAATLLQETDWVELGDVADPANPPYLSNKAAFTSYRAGLRSIAVNPPTTPAVFPAKPDEVWLS